MKNNSNYSISRSVGSSREYFKALVLAPTSEHTLRGHGLTVRLDPKQCIPSDPGAGCPAVVSSQVYSEDEGEINISATWICLREEQTLDGWPLTASQRRWVADISAAVETWYAGAWALAKAGCR